MRPSELLAAVLDLEKRRLQPDSWLDTLSAPGKRWNLVYTVPAKDVVAAQKKKAGGGSGAYFPLTAAQKFDATDATFENGVFLSSLASLTFKGPYSMKDRRMAFDVTTMYLALGPWRFPITLKRDAPRLEQRPPADVVKLPFFLYAYVDSSCVVARGRSGGLAVWRSVDTEWQAKSGVLQVYK